MSERGRIAEKITGKKSTKIWQEQKNLRSKFA